jgi:hypothetical protein
MPSLIQGFIRQGQGLVQCDDTLVSASIYFYILLYYKRLMRPQAWIHMSAGYGNRENKQRNLSGAVHGFQN